MNKTLVITGGSRGIGFATIQRFIAEGYKVINLSRQAPDISNIVHLPTDLADINWPAKLASQLSSALENTDRINVVHNAAVLAKDTISTVDAEDFQRVMQLNVIAASQLNQLLLPLMNKGSAIIYISSTLGEKAVANSCSYVSSKHAQIGLMRATCQDLMGRGIHTAAICPGFTDTQMLRLHVGNDSEVLNYFANLNSFNRLLEPKEIAGTIWFCTQTPAINGSVIHANLGQLEN